MFTSTILKVVLLAAIFVVRFIGAAGAQVYPIEIVNQLGHEGPVSSISVSPNGRTLVTSHSEDIVIWDFETGRQLRSISREPASNSFSDSFLRYRYAAILPDNLTVAVLGADKTLEFFDLSTGKKLRELKVEVRGVRFEVSRDGKRAEVGEGKVIDLYDGRIVGDFVKNVYRPPITAMSPDGKLISISDESTTEVIEIATRRRLSQISHGPGLKATALAPDGRTVAFLGMDGQLRLVDANTALEIRRFDVAKTDRHALKFSQDGGSILLKSGTRELTLFDVSTGSHIRKLVNDVVITEFAFSPDGMSALAGGLDGSVVIWNLSAGSQRKLSGQAWGVSSYFSSGGGPLRGSAWNTAWSELASNRINAEASEIALKSGERVTVTREGFFDTSSPVAAKNLNVVRGVEVYSIDQVYQALYRPDLVREKLAGDPKGLVREAAAKLDLNKVMASGAAPRVSILTPAGDVANDEVTVEATIAEQNGGGIGRIEWRVNGVTLGVEARGLQRLPEGTASAVASRPAVTVKRTLSLEPGENRIEVVAYNGRDLISSDPAQVILKWDGEKSAIPPKLHVLAVGVNDYYDSRLKLSYAVPDARAIGEAMKKAGSSIYQSVEVTSVLDDGVTIENLDKVFAEVSSKVHPRDVFVFFLAGHGKTKNGRYYFLPRNFRYEDETSIERTAVGQDKLQAWLAKIPARKSILLYDTCESGSLTGGNARGNDIEERLGALNRMTRATGRTFLTATTDDAPALEGYRGHGVFTYALLDALSKADTNDNGLIEVTELAAFIDQQVPDLSFKAFKMRQIPQMKIVGNSFPVVSKTTVLQSAGDTQADTAKTSATIPTRPTHVVVSQSPVDVFMAAARGGTVIQKLPPGTTVTLIEGANGWQLVAKDGQKLGFVEEKALVRLQ